ncbi:MAG: hypothetical protein ACRDYX_07205 [Egibacteraceae bacterium]
MTEPTTAEEIASPPSSRAGETGQRRGVGAALASARVAWAVALLATATAVLLASWWAPLQRAETTREEVRQAATRMVLQFTTFQGATIDKWVDDAKTMATGRYADQLTTLFDQDLRNALRERQVRSVGAIIDLFVQDVDGTQAKVFAVMRQTIHNQGTPKPAEDELRIELEMRREHGRWLASNVSVLAPDAGLSGPAPGSGNAKP